MKFIRTKKGNKTIFRVVEENFRDSNKKVNSGDSDSAYAHMIHKEGYVEETVNSTNKLIGNCPLPFSNDIAPSISFIVETNLTLKKNEMLSVEMGEEIASIIIDEIIASQSSNLRAIHE